ncbi:MAG: TIGR03560 family F420-dependent LLM class oxidoreductase [Acidimicrobiales bacterium]
MTSFGVHTGLQHTSMADLIQLWGRIEAAGYDWISIWDHFYAADMTGSAECFEAVAAHAALAAHTSRVRCGSLVYCVGYRHPAVLAKAIATVDHISGGRAELGLGAGWSQIEYDAYGIPFPNPGTRLDQLEEAVQCIRHLLRDEETTFGGRHVTLRAARAEPRPLQEALPIWIGGGGERRTLKIAATYADGWNVPFLSPEDFGAKRAVLHRHCEAVGRDPEEIRCAVNVGLAWEEEDLERQFANMANFVRPGVLTGSQEEVLDRIGRYVEAGADQVNIAVRAPWTPEGLERLAGVLGLSGRINSAG